jgi:hypothetical protein
VRNVSGTKRSIGCATNLVTATDPDLLVKHQEGLRREQRVGLALMPETMPCYLEGMALT